APRSGGGGAGRARPGLGNRVRAGGGLASPGGTAREARQLLKVGESAKPFRPVALRAVEGDAAGVARLHADRGKQTITTSKPEWVPSSLKVLCIFSAIEQQTRLRAARPPRAQAALRQQRSCPRRPAHPGSPTPPSTST